MRTLLLLLLLLAAATAHAAESALADPYAPKVYTPAVVAQLADAYVTSLDRAKPAVNPAEAKNDFQRTFLIGFTQPGVSLGRANEAQTRGLEAGQAYRRDHPEKLKEIMEGFGYTAIDVDGFWKFGFETSEFRPKNKPREIWWVTELGKEGAAKSAAGRAQVRPTQEGAQVHLSGFLSPEGHYGHFGVGRRELIATSVTPAK